MRLVDNIQERDNNFNALRIVAACLVLFTHSFALATGSAEAEPLRSRLGMTLGMMAVDIFFFVSGFLVTASLLSRGSTIGFVVARALRIFPGLFVMLLLTVLGVGIAVTTLSASAYLSNPQTAEYFIKCLTLLTGVEYRLPGVFASNPYANSVNGSLWTLPYELRAYLFLATAWFALSVAGRYRPALLGILIFIATLVLGALVALGHLGAFADNGYFLRLYFLFAEGGLFFIMRAQVVFSRARFIACFVAIVMSALSPDAFFFVYTGLVGYLVLHAAYLPDGWIKHYNRFGDYSYGVYIYSFVVQQTIVMMIPGISIPALFVSSALVTLACAVLSWHLVEKPALAFKA